MRVRSTGVRKDTQAPAKLYGETFKEVDRYMYLGLPFGAKGLDTGKMCEIGIAKGYVWPAYSTRLDVTVEGSRLQLSGES